MSTFTVVTLSLLFSVVCMAASDPCGHLSSKYPLMSMRLRSGDTATKDVWKSVFKAVSDNPGCCDEIWFSTGIGTPPLEWHRSHAEVLAVAVKDARLAGIAPSLQFQATIGHDDIFVTEEMCAMKTWTGWTDWKGTETRFCNCPRQKAFLQYLRDVSTIYAKIGFSSVWIDDDLRLEHHKPADSYGRLSGCFCDTCIAAFNVETGGSWTRGTLANAVEKDDAICAKWRDFSIDGLALTAKVIAEAFASVSPDTMMALQHSYAPGSEDQIAKILKTLHAETGRPVGCRPGAGGGSYYDDDPNSVVLKSINAATLRSRIGDPDYVKVWTPEIESWPRTYYSRSAQGVLIEGFAALMYGFNSVSFFASNSQKENPRLTGTTMWRPIAEASSVLRGYAYAIDGCIPVGFTMPMDNKIGVRCMAVPVISGIGRSVGELTEKEIVKNANRMTSEEVQKFRDELDARAGGLPAAVKSPFKGLMQVHVDTKGMLRSVALMNLRITDQEPVRILLRSVPSAWKGVLWNEMRRKPIKIEIERIGSEAYATIPSVGAWNGGYMTGY